MAAFSEDGSEWSEYGYDEELHRDLSSLQEVLADDSRPGCHGDGGGTEDEGHRPLEGLKLCLQKNQQLQAMLQQQLGRIEQKLAVNRHNQHLVKSLPRTDARRRFSLSRFRRGLSYFKDHRGKPPPFYCARDEKHWNFYIDNYWRPDKEDVKLKTGVRDQCIVLKSQPLQRRLQATEDPNEQRELRKQISELRHLPDTELTDSITSQIDWDRLAFECFDSCKLGSDCRLRWENCINPAWNSQPWNPREDKLLFKLGQRHEYCNWNIIAAELKTNRNAFACLKRYQRSLNPKMFKSEWTEEDDVALKSAITKYGEKNWKAVAQYVGVNRTAQQCLHRWKNSLFPGIKKGRWISAEDEQLREAVRLFGVGNWSKITTLVPSRTPVQCRERWVNVLDNHINRGPWSKEDDRKLFELCSKYTGPISWSKVAAGMGNRTDSMCSYRWKLLSNPGDIVTQYASRMKQREVLMKNFHGRRKHRSSLSSDDIEDDLLSEATKEKLKSYEQKVSKRKKLDRNVYISRYYAQLGLKPPLVTDYSRLVQKSIPSLGTLVEQPSETTGPTPEVEDQATLQPMRTSTSELQTSATGSASSQNAKKKATRRKKRWSSRKRRRQSVSLSGEYASLNVGDRDEVCPSVSTSGAHTEASVSCSKGTSDTSNDFAEFPSYRSVIVPPSTSPMFTELSQLPKHRYLYKYLTQAALPPPVTMPAEVTTSQMVSHEPSQTDKIPTSASRSPPSTSTDCPKSPISAGDSSATMYETVNAFIHQYEKAGIVNDLAEFPNIHSLIVPQRSSVIPVAQSASASRHPPMELSEHSKAPTSADDSASSNPMSVSGSIHAPAGMYDRANTLLRQYEIGAVTNNLAEFPSGHSMVVPQHTSMISAAQSDSASGHPPITHSGRSKTLTSATSAPGPSSSSGFTGASNDRANIQQHGKEGPVNDFAEFPSGHSMIVPQRTSVISAAQSDSASGHPPITLSKTLASATSAPGPSSSSGFTGASAAENDRANIQQHGKDSLVNDFAEFRNYHSMIVPQCTSVMTFPQLPQHRYTHKYPPVFPTTTQKCVPTLCNASTSTASAATTLPLSSSDRHSRLYPNPSPILSPGYPPYPRASPGYHCAPTVTDGYHPMHSFPFTLSSGVPPLCTPVRGSHRGHYIPVHRYHHGYPPVAPASTEPRIPKFTGACGVAMDFNVGGQSPSHLAVTTTNNDEMAHVTMGSLGSVSLSQQFTDSTSGNITPRPSLPEPVLLIDTPTTSNNTCSVPQCTASTQTTTESQSTSSMAAESRQIGSTTIADEATIGNHMAVAVTALLELHNATFLEGVGATTSTQLPAMGTQISSEIDGTSARVYSMSPMQRAQEASSVTNTISSCLPSVPHLVSETDCNNTAVGGAVSATTSQKTRSVGVSVGESHLLAASTCHAPLSQSRFQGSNEVPKSLLPVSSAGADGSKPVSSTSDNLPPHQRKNGPKLQTEKTPNKVSSPDCVGNRLNPRDLALCRHAEVPDTTAKETEKDDSIFEVTRQPENATLPIHSGEKVSSHQDEVSEASISGTQKLQIAWQGGEKQKSMEHCTPVCETSETTAVTGTVAKPQSSESQKSLPRLSQGTTFMETSESNNCGQLATASQANSEPVEGDTADLGATGEPILCSPPPQTREVDVDAEISLVDPEITSQKSNRRMVLKERGGCRSGKRKARGVKRSAKKMKIA